MKRVLFLVCAVGVIGLAHAFVRPEPAHWTATVKVVDETGQPVVSAEVLVSYAMASPDGQSRNWRDITGLTGTNGVFTASHTDRSIYLGFQARKSGYYPDSLQHDVGLSPQDHHERLTPIVTLTLKRIIKPIPMYAKWVSNPVPTLDEPVAYDLTTGDWVAPYGSGTKTDIIFTAHRVQRATDDADYRLKVSFPNQGDGIQEFRASPAPVGQGSGLRSPHQAPLGGYQFEWIQWRMRRPGQPVDTNRDENRNYFFRVRTVLDEEGNVKSALYGKIYGDFMQFRYYLNPTLNDRNVEFDPEQNLLEGLKSTEKVMEP